MKNKHLAGLFTISIFISALLLFMIQPLIAKMLLPFLGGSPSVWNTCMVFFQGVLLAGYGYSHVLPTWIGLRRHAFLHIGLLAAAALFLPFAVSSRAVESVVSGANPSLWLLGALLSTVGLPFFILSTNGPLLQRWFASTSHPDARDPYFLYSASNLGSLLALLSYPLLVEPGLRLSDQSRLWAVVYALMVVLIALCAIAFGWQKTSEKKAEVANPIKDGFPVEEITLGRRLLWVLLAFVPSSLMLGVTTYISTNLAPIPLLWVMPLSLYLLTFALVFTKRPIVPGRLLARYILPALTLVLLYVWALGVDQPLWLLIALHLVVFLVSALVCHGRLASDRPRVEHLTEFYLWIAVGGVLGGIFNALLAPVLFSKVIEYPLMIVMVCLLRPSGRAADERFSAQRLDYLLPAGMALLIIGLALLLSRMDGATAWIFIVLPTALFLAYTFVERRVRFALALGAVIMGTGFYSMGGQQTLHVGRNFFGVLRVTSDSDGSFHRLQHGNTQHGRQFINPERRCEPISYYHRSGPFGSVYDTFTARQASPHVAVAGLGTGAMASYSTPAQTWTFYEIDLAVVRVAENPSYFTYLKGCARSPVSIMLGDARLRFREAPAGRYGLIVLDAFSSDAIPLHLMTREAVNLYLSKLGPGGIISFHISNRHLNLEPVLGGIAATDHLVCLVNKDINLSPEDVGEGKDPSIWVVMARNSEDLGELNNDPRWKPVSTGQKPIVWTDDFSNIYSVFK